MIKDNQLDYTNSKQVVPALDIDWRGASTFSKTISANSVFTFSNVIDGKTLIVILKNTSGAPVSVTLPATVKWPDGSALGVSITAGKTCLYTFFYDANIGIIVGSAIEEIS